MREYFSNAKPVIDMDLLRSCLSPPSNWSNVVEKMIKILVFSTTFDQRLTNAFEEYKEA